MYISNGTYYNRVAKGLRQKRDAKNANQKFLFFYFFFFCFIYVFFFFLCDALQI